MSGSKNSSLGKALFKHRFSNKKKSSFLHTTDLDDGVDWNKVNFKSVTEQNTLDDFLFTAALASRQFNAERTGAIISTGNLGPTKEEIARNVAVQMEYRSSLRVPRRPGWDATTTPQELDEMERQTFLEWRHSLSILSEKEGIIITPYEKNLEFWRQLWRVIERSDVVVQIVDARNPLLFRCEDLESYVKEVNHEKINVILINKADFLNESQRKHWLEYFNDQGLTAYFFSALKELEECSEEEEVETSNISVLTRQQLLECFRKLGTEIKGEGELVTVGLVGYPNVGKSSTLNALLKEKILSEHSRGKHYHAATSSTPGKTKHFQTIFVDEYLLLCDCPGLVMPNFVSSKADMITNGILPIDQMQGYMPPVAVVCKNIPKRLLELTYGIILPIQDEESSEDTPDPYKLLTAYARVRGFMTAKGVPDCSRAARIILKDYMNGKLCYCHNPPTVSEEEYGSRAVVPENIESFVPQKVVEATKNAKMPKGMVSFVRQKEIETFTKSIDKKELIQQQLMSKKHFNKSKRTKLRRLYKNEDDSD